VQRKFFSFFTYSLVVFSLLASCTKIDSTTIGGDLLPAVDNVNTTEETFDITGTQGTFADATTTTRTTTHVLGYIGNDPVFGKTKADVFVELRPNFYPYYYGAAKDTIDEVINPPAGQTGYDSVVLCLAVKGYYGDTLTPHTFRVYTIDNSNTEFRDSAFLLSYRPTGWNGTEVGSATVLPYRVKDTIHYPGSAKLTVNNQIRIKLSESFLQSLINNTDTSEAANTIYRSEANFRSFLKGFSIVQDNGTQGNGLFYISLTDVATRLEVHYKKRKDNILDTAFTAMYLTATSTTNNISASAHANFLQRDSSASEMKNNPQADALYIQSTPGTYAILSIPGIANMSNRVIHRAEVIVEQIPSSDPVQAELDTKLLPPAYLYLDLVDTAAGNDYKPVYIDLNTATFYDPDNSLTFLPPGGTIDFNYYGGFLRKKTNQFGKPVFYYTFNISRHFQRMVTNKGYNYNFRLSSPYELLYYGYKVPYVNNLANGSIKIGNGNNANYKLRLRLVYSTI
jgi:hypothetical protein